MTRIPTPISVDLKSTRTLKYALFKIKAFEIQIFASFSKFLCFENNLLYRECLVAYDV